MPTRRVLFAIRDPRSRSQPGLAKAIQVARARGASLELFHALTDALFVEMSRFQRDAVVHMRERVESEAANALARLCTVARKHRVPASYCVQWGHPPHQAIVQRALSRRVDLIIAECHHGARTTPWMIHLTDWELLRTSPMPVLLIKHGKPYHRPLVLAAVDPAHAHAKPLPLDSRIVDGAADLAKGLRGTVHIAHANYPSIVGAEVGAAASKAARSWSTFSLQELEERERELFEAFRASAGIPRTRAHLVDGNPVVAIPAIARKLRAGIVVMGALSRSGLERVFIGNTAERVLGALPCDVLVVKPAQLEARATA